MNQLKTVDVLLFNSHQEFQVSGFLLFFFGEEEKEKEKVDGYRRLGREKREEEKRREERRGSRRRGKIRRGKRRGGKN